MRTAFLSALAVVALGSTSAFAAGATPKACTAPPYRQFDFWVGHWDVTVKGDAKKKIIAHSLIESLYDGCAVHENWMPLTHAGGGSINAYQAETKTWRQFWADGQATSAMFTGGLKGKSMVISGVWPQPGHPAQITRITYTPLADGSVEQLGVTSDDKGKSWQPSFDFIYSRAAK